MTPFDRQQIEAWIESRTGDINLELIADVSEQAKSSAIPAHLITESIF